MGRMKRGGRLDLFSLEWKFVPVFEALDLLGDAEVLAVKEERDGYDIWKVSVYFLPPARVMVWVTHDDLMYDTWGPGAPRVDPGRPFVAELPGPVDEEELRRAAEELALDLATGRRTIRVRSGGAGAEAEMS